MPTCTPRILTLASGFITRPARSEIRVTGSVLVKLPRNSANRQAEDQAYGDHRSPDRRVAARSRPRRSCGRGVRPPA